MVLIKLKMKYKHSLKEIVSRTMAYLKYVQNGKVYFEINVADTLYLLELDS